MTTGLENELTQSTAELLANTAANEVATDPPARLSSHMT